MGAYIHIDLVRTEMGAYYPDSTVYFQPINALNVSLFLFLPCVHRKCIRDRWDKQKTLRQNLSAMGLAIDPNTAIPIVPPKSSEVGRVWNNHSVPICVFRFSVTVVRTYFQPSHVSVSCAGSYSCHC